MKAMGTEIGTIHFVGIGGIGMSGIAEVMHHLGYKVQGSDNSESYVTEGLRKIGIPVMIGQSADNLGDAAVVVCSTAIREDNPEIQAAAERRLPRVRRAEMLAELMRMQMTIAVAGTHGKTTTTSMISAMLDAGGIDPTVINGGIINAYGSNARLGKSDWMVVEADESDGSFLRLDGTIAVVTNIDPEHLEHYGDFDAVKDAFVEFVENVPFYGLAVMCVDDADVQGVLEPHPRPADRDLWNVGAGRPSRRQYRPREWRQPVRHLGPPGRRRAAGHRGHVRADARASHNVLNALAAIAVGMEFGFSDEVLKNGFRNFTGVKRRFTRVGEVDGAAIIDDYAHHPVEIKSVLSAAREAAQERVIAVVQPHRYTRLRDLMDDFQNAFNDADVVFVAPVYPAGEEPIEGIDAAALADGLRAHGHRLVKTVESMTDLAANLRDLAAEGDIVICMGAGDITKWAAGLGPAIAAARAAK